MMRLMKNLVLAEKPSVGKELARVLGCVNRGKYLESDDYVVTWALGHLVTLCPPDFYGAEYRRWQLRDLPILPKKLETMVIDKTKDQFEIVKHLLDREDVAVSSLPRMPDAKGSLWLAGYSSRPVARSLRSVFG